MIYLDQTRTVDRYDHKDIKHVCYLRQTVQLNLVSQAWRVASLHGHSTVQDVMFAFLSITKIIYLLPSGDRMQFVLFAVCLQVRLFNNLQFVRVIVCSCYSLFAFCSDRILSRSHFGQIAFWSDRILDRSHFEQIAFLMNI